MGRGWRRGRKEDGCGGGGVLVQGEGNRGLGRHAKGEGNRKVKARGLA